MIPTVMMLVAQAATPTPAPSTTAIALPICLTRPFKDAHGATLSLAVAVRPETAATLVATGFTVTACSGLNQTAEQYSSEVCGLAASGNSAVQARLTQVLGAAPRLLCSEATTLGSLLAAALQVAH